MAKLWIVLILVITPIIHGARKSTLEDRKTPIEYVREATEVGRGSWSHRRSQSHEKRHPIPNYELKKRSTTPKPMRDIRKKPSGHLTPLEDDDMENDEVVSVAIGPPPIRAKYEKPRKKKPRNQPTTVPTTSLSAVGLMKDLLMELTREFLTKDVNENFVFGQYLGNSMKNLTGNLRLSMQHEVLELIVKYQKLNRGDVKEDVEFTRPPVIQMLKDVIVDKKISSSNDTEETWPDFSNLARIVG